MKIKEVNIFSEIDLRDYLESRKKTILQAIENEDPDYILKVNEDQYIAHHVSEARVDHLCFDEENRYISSCEKLIPAQQFPRSFNVHPGKSYKKSVITLHVPFMGDPTLLRCTPSRHIVWSMPVNLRARPKSP